MTTLRTRAVLPCCLIAALASPIPLEPQTPPGGCTHETCALRIRWSPLSWLFMEPWVVRGEPGESISSLDDTDYFRRAFGAVPGTSVHYDDFVASDRWSDALRHLGLAAMLTGAVAQIFRGEDAGWPLAVIVSGFSLRLASEIPGRKARQAFTRAADLYNQALPPP